MSSAHDLAVLSFDLDFLRPTADNIPVSNVAALKKKIINPVKNRIVRVSVLIKHVRGMKNDIANKSDEIELLKSKLEFNTQEFTKLTLEYKDLLENYSKCEKERDDLKTAIKTYTEKYYEAENRVLAGKSHIVQLEHLIKQHERQIDTLKKKDNTKNYKPLKLLKDNLAKELESWKNKYKQERTEWQTKYNTLLKRLQHEKGGTGNLTKNISSNNVNDDIGEHSDIEDDISIGFLSPLTQDPSQNNVSMDQQSSVGSVSVDTGCGSSLASSDNEKWLNSPDYLFSPIHDITNNPSVIGKNIDTATSPISPVKMVDVATSPIAIQPNVNATSPIPSLKIVDVAISPITIQPDNTATCPISPVKIVDVANSPITKLPDNTATGPAPPVKIVDVATSPVTLQPTDTASSPIPGVKIIDVATSPITIQPDDSAASPVPKSCDSAIFPINIQLEPYECCENLSESPTANNISVNCNINDAEVTITNKTVEHAEIESPVKILHELPYQDISELDPDTIVEETIYIDIQEIETKNCLELNNSNNVEEDNSTNYEVETILNTMRLNHSLITPIPTTPTKNASSMHIRTYSHHTQTETPIHYACSDAALAKDQAAAAKEEAAKAIKDNEKRNEYTEGIVANLVSLMKDMINVKTFLKNKFSYSDTEYTQDDNSLPLNKFYENSNFNNDLHTLLNSGDPVQDSIIDRDLSRSPTPLSDIIKIIEPHQHSMENINKIETLHKEMELESPSKQNNLPLETKRVTYSNMSTTKLETKSKTKKPRRGILKKARKLTNLAKYRKKIEVPKYKIRRETPPLRKPRMKPKQILNYGIKKVTRTDTSATLNDKQIYAKAVKVMTELNAKKLMNSTETVLTSTIPKEKAAENIDICQPNILPSMTSPKLVVLVTPLTLAKASPTLQNTASVTEITSPKLQITSPIQKTKSRRRSLRSSKSDILCEDVAVTSPDVGVMSPDVAVTSPDFAVTSSNVAVTSPDAAVPTPNVTITSRKTATSDYLLSPKTTAISAKKSPTPILTSPTASTNYLRRSVRLSSAESPKYVTTPPNLDITSHRTLVTSPKLSVKPYLSATPLSPPVASSEHVRTRSKSHFIKSCTNYGTGIHETQLQRDSSINKSLLENKSRKRTHSNDYDTPTKRVLRSSIKGLNPKEHTTLDDVVNKDDPLAPNLIPIQEDLSSWHPKESILCCMIQKYGITTKRPVFRNVPDTILETICGKIERYMSKFHESLNKDNTMNEMVEEFKPCNYKNFVAGLVKYLTEPDRKMELFGKTSAPPAPQMTKSEAGLLFVIRGLRKHWQPVDIVHVILSSLEYRLFRLNRTPDFDVIESVSHFYALVCRYFGLQSRLKAFMFDAMYFILYKSAPIIKQCLEVWPHIIPLAHMSAAKIPLVTIFVYLLHFYKCDDKSSRVQDIRTILNRRYSYQLTDWNETKLLELVTNSISELRDNPCEKKMLRIAIIILGKRHGPRWTQHNIIKKLFQFIDKETLPVHILEFCISMIGPLMKPYSNDMKVQCEIAINQLMRILDTTTSKRIEEVTISSIVTMSRHSSQRVDELLLSRKMGVMSPALEELIRGYIRTKPLHIWLKLLSRPCVV